MHCSDPGCLKACPSPGAIVQYANGIVDISFAILFLRFWRLNMPNWDDLQWMLRIGDIVQNRHDRLPAIGKYSRVRDNLTSAQLTEAQHLAGALGWIGEHR